MTVPPVISAVTHANVLVRRRSVVQRLSGSQQAMIVPSPQILQKTRIPTVHVWRAVPISAEAQTSSPTPTNVQSARSDKVRGGRTSNATGATVSGYG